MCKFFFGFQFTEGARAEHTLYKGNYHCRYSWSPAVWLTRLDSVALLNTDNNIFSCLVEFNPVKLEASCAIIQQLPYIIFLTLCFHFQKTNSNFQPLCCSSFGASPSAPGRRSNTISCRGQTRDSSSTSSRKNSKLWSNFECV